MSATGLESNPPGNSNQKWLNRNVVGMGLTSLHADAGYEMANAVLPSFLEVIGMTAAALGAIEGVAGALSASVKLGMGWYSDRIGHRKETVRVNMEEGRRLLAEIKTRKELKNMALLRIGRLSVTPVTSQEWATITKMAEQ